MAANPSLHVVQRADGVWQVEREDEIVPQSIHANREQALDAALTMARREHRPLRIHRLPRRAARWVDRVAWAVLDGEVNSRRHAS